MTVDIATLAIRIDSLEAREATRDLDRLSGAGRRAEQQGDVLTKTMQGLAAVFATMKIVDAAEALIKTQREFDKLNASLITATGSVVNANQAFGALQSFAASTPYGLAEVTKAFIQLRNLGLTPSERALNSYGNTASAMSKSLSQMVEAVADAATGEFERLKEFGIKAKQNGDAVALTFQGATTSIANNAASIEKYLIELGETKFAGGMELQAKTLDGAISNLGDTWDMTKLAFAQSGFGDGAMAGVLALSAALTDLQAIMRATGLAVSGEAKAAEEAGAIHKSLTTVFEALAIGGEGLAYSLRNVGKDIGMLMAVGGTFFSGMGDGLNALGRAADGLFKGGFGDSKAVANGFSDALASVQKTFNSMGVINEERRKEQEEDLRATDARIARIVNASAVEKKIRDDASRQKSEEGRDDLARYAIKQQAAGQSAEAIKKEAEAYRALIGPLREAAAANALQIETGVAMTASQKAIISLNEDLRTKKITLTKEHEKEVRALIESVGAQDRWLKSAQQTKAAVAELADQRQSDFASAAGELAANERAVEVFGMTKAQIEALTVARLQDRLANAASLELTVDDIAQTERLIEVKQRNVAALTKLQNLDTGSDVTKAKELLDILRAVDEAARQAAQGMEDSFGRVGSAIGGLTTALTGYAVQQQAIAAQLAAVKADPKNSAQKIAQAEIAASKASAQAQIKSYGDMASAAKGFFSENSKGYKTLQAAEKAYRAVEMVMAIQSMVQKLFAVNTVTAATVAGEVTKTAAVEAGTAAQVASDMVKGTSAAAVGVATQAEGDPYTAWARMAAMAAAMAALGFSVGGGGSGKSISQQRQESQGTGTVFGDSTAKSDSIKRSIELFANNSSIELDYTRNMLTSLRGIESSLSGLSNLLIRTSGISGDLPETVNGSTSDLVETLFGHKLLGSAAGNFAANVSNAIFGGRVTALDGGVTIDPVALGKALSAGVNASKYVDTKKSGGLFHSDKYSTQYTDLGDAADRQFSAVIANIAGSVSAAADLLGLGGDAFTAHLNQFVVDIGKVSLKDLDGEEIQAALETVFSKLGDDLAQFAVAGLEQFQQVGEGYLETLTRVALNYANLDSILASSGTSFGQTGIASIAARERLIALAGGIDELASQAQSFNENFLTEAERLAPVQKYVTDQLAAMGLQSLDTRDKFKDYVLGLADSGKLATEAGAQQYTALLALADAFAKTHAATVDLTKSEQAIADERADLQNKLDELTMTQEQLAAKARAAIDGHNLALYDQVIAAQAAKDATQAAADAVANAAQALLTGVNKAYSDLQASIGAQKTVIKTAYDATMAGIQTSLNQVTGSVAKLKSLSQSLQSTIDSMRLSAGDEVSARVEAQAQVATALAIAKAGGPLPDADSLKDALATLTKDPSEQFASYLDYQRDAYKTQNDLAALAALTDDQLSTEERALAMLEKQKDLAQLAYDAEVLRLDGILDTAKAQVDLLNGISAGIASIPAALASLAAAIKAAMANPIASAGSTAAGAYNQYLSRDATSTEIDFWKGEATKGVDIAAAIKGSNEAKIQELYQTLLGRTGEAAGVYSWQQALASGKSWDDVKAGFLGSDEYQKLHVPGFAGGGDHLGGLRIVGENGPELEATGPSRIFNAGQTRSMLGSASDELVGEVRELRRENAEWRAMQEAHLYAIAKSTRNTEDFLDGAVNGDIPIATREVEVTA
jgi:hypothetical protein